jgi:prepilin-type N-terminal cleavage/methylation domain-containing protein
MITRASTPKRDWGFTLIEIMIVITIIGLLAAIILIGLDRVRTLGRDTKRIADLRVISTGLEVFFARNQSYPQIPGTSTWTLQTDPFPAALINAGIGITRIPTDPLNRAPFVYAYGSGNPWTSYVLRALLENNDNPALRDSPSGMHHGVDCGPVWGAGTKGTAGSNSFYCLRF